MSGNTANASQHSGFTGGAIHLGSHNGLPVWVWALLALAAVYVVIKQ